MTDQFKSMEERVKLFKSFYRRENKRPLLGFYVGSEYPIPRYPSMSKLAEGRALTPEDFPIEEFIVDSENLHIAHEQCGGDFIWSATAYWGIPWLEAFLGCPIYANHSSGSIYSEPPESFDSKNYDIRFDPDNPWVKLMDVMFKELAVKSAGRWPIATTRMRGLTDLLSALYGGTEFVMAMLTDPHDVHRIADMLVKFWVEAAKFQLERIPSFYGGIGSFYYYAWAPKKTVWYQEDAVTLLSPDLYSEFIEERMRTIVNSLEGTIMHQHSTGFVPTESYLKMNFHALELHIDEGGPSAEELSEKYHSILSTKPLIIWGDISEKDMDWIFSNLPPEGLSVITIVKNCNEAKEIWHKYQRGK